MHSGNLFAAFVALLQKRHETSASKSKNQPVNLSKINSVWTEMHESEMSEWEFGQKDNSFMLSLEQPIMHHNQRDTNRLQTFKLLQKFGHEVKHEVLHVRIIHKTWACMIVHLQKKYQ